MGYSTTQPSHSQTYNRNKSRDIVSYDRVKTQCEERLCNLVTRENVQEIVVEAERFRAQI
jgi:hypothetical protein